MEEPHKRSSMTIIDKDCYERGCACYDDRVDKDGVAVVARQGHMTKLEAWKAWCESAGTPDLATEFTLEQSSHGKAFSFAWERGFIDGMQRQMQSSVDKALNEKREIATWMMAQGYATGHGDSIEDLLKELEWQVKEREREACAKVCEERQEVFEKYYTKNLAAMCAEAIRARGEQ